jgi:hypothetical protein
MNYALRLLAASLLLLLVIGAACRRQAAAAELASDRGVEPLRAHEEKTMSSSTLTPGNLPAGPDRRVHRGHGTSALGPSDSSDSGSDMLGVPGVSPPDEALVGDGGFDSDSDRNGSGERASAENDGAEGDGATDIGTDHTERMPRGALEGNDNDADQDEEEGP